MNKQEEARIRRALDRDLPGVERSQRVPTNTGETPVPSFRKLFRLTQRGQDGSVAGHQTYVPPEIIELSYGTRTVRLVARDGELRITSWRAFGDEQVLGEFQL